MSECHGRRLDRDAFLAHIWLSSYLSDAGLRMAVVIWDASEHLREREQSTHESFVESTRALLSAFAHEVRNLSATAQTAFLNLAAPSTLRKTPEYAAMEVVLAALSNAGSTMLQGVTAKEGGTVDVRHSIDTLRVIVEPALREAGVEAVWECEHRLPPVFCNPHVLLQVFLNLERNAERALAGLPGPELRISARCEAGRVAVRFLNNGPLIEDPQELFQAFRSRYDSSGLGLYVSRALLETRGGNLRYEPVEGKCCFVVELAAVGDV